MTTYITQFYDWYHKNFHTCQTANITWTIKTTKSNVETQPEQPKHWNQRGFSLVRQSLCSCNWGNANSWVFIFKLCNKPTTQAGKSCGYLSNFTVNFVHFIHHQFCTLHRPKIPVLGLLSHWVHLIHP